MTDRERLQAAIDEALAHLGERAGASAAATAELPERIVDRTEAAVRKKLGDTIYDLARRCFKADSEAARFMGDCGVPPPDGAVLRSRAALYTARATTRESDGPPNDSWERIQTLDDAIDALEQLEGPSDSSEYLRCLRHVATGDWVGLLTRSRRLARDANQEFWRRHAGLESVLALLQLNRFEEAVAESLSISATHGATRGLIFNRACAFAHLKQSESFFRAAAEFVSCSESEGDGEFWRRQVEDHGDLFESCLGLSRSAALRAFGVG